MESSSDRLVGEGPDDGRPAHRIRRGMRGSLWHGLTGLSAIILSVWLLPPGAKLGRPDEQYYGAIAWTVLRGGVMYRDSWDNKGPVIHYALAAVTAATRGSPRSYSLTALLLVLIAQGGLILALAKAGKPVAGAGAAALLAISGAAAMAAMLSAELAAAAMMALALVGVTAGSPFAGGLCMGLALLSKPSVAPPVVAALPAWIAAEAAAKGRPAARRLAAQSLLGVFLGCAVPVAVLVGAGAGPDMYRLLIGYNLAHVRAVPWHEALAELVDVGLRHLGRTAAVSLLPLVALPVLLRGRAREDWSTPLGRCIAVTSAWFLASLMTYPMLKHYREPFAYYLLPMVPAGAVLTSLGCAAVRCRNLVYVACLASVCLVAAYGASNRARVASGAWRRIFTGRDLAHWAASDAVRAGLYVRSRSWPEDRVWCGPGATAAAFWTQRGAGCRVICPDYYVNVWPGRVDRWVPPMIAAVFADTWDVVRADLEVRRPLYVILSAGRELPAQEYAATARLRRMLAPAYAVETTIGNLQLWRRRGPVTP
ncbi:MAG: hypothetical protein N2512_01965 [Armatimonadetes bacterium]|nr:hypothetical protein [Armatimonadota bacterium]